MPARMCAVNLEMMMVQKDCPPSKTARPAENSGSARKILTYTVRPVGGTWHWEVRENQKLIDSGTVNSMVKASAMAFSAAMMALH